MARADARVLFLAPVLMFAAAAPVAARGGGATTFAIPGGPLDRALAALAAQAGIDVGGTAAGIPSVRVREVHGRMTAAAALARLLRDTPFAATRIDDRTYRIARRPLPVRRRPVVPPPPDLPPSPPPDIVVTAAKTAVDRLRFPGAFTILGTGRDHGDDAQAGVGDAAATAPVIQRTALGSGRNKLFIRGVADSSFGGPTQSTSAVYWGDTPVAYAGADPNLNLFDVDRIEVLEGPQGTLYGAGAIGGVIRVEPRRPDLSAIDVAAATGVRLTRGGAAGTDLAAMLNVPVVRDAVALRAVGYRVEEGGYIDDASRDRRNVNGVRTIGGRLALRVAPAPGWSIAAGAIGQRVRSDDLQYAERGLPGLARASTLAQPFRQRYGLVQLRVEHRGDGGVDWLTAIGHAARDAEARFDATRSRPVPIAYDTDERNRFVTIETRLSKGRPDGAGWLVGAAILRGERPVHPPVRAARSPAADRRHRQPYDRHVDLRSGGAAGPPRHGGDAGRARDRAAADRRGTVEPAAAARPRTDGGQDRSDGGCQLEGRSRDRPLCALSVRFPRRWRRGHARTGPRGATGTGLRSAWSKRASGTNDRARWASPDRSAYPPPIGAGCRRTSSRPRDFRSPSTSTTAISWGSRRRAAGYRLSG